MTKAEAIKKIREARVLVLQVGDVFNTREVWNAKQALREVTEELESDDPYWREAWKGKMDEQVVGDWKCFKCGAKGSYVCQGSPGTDLRVVEDVHSEVSPFCETPELELS